MGSELEGACELCNGSGTLDVLNIWLMQRRALDGEVSYDSAEALPMLKQAIRCPRCYSSETSSADMEALTEKMGGNPYAESTFLQRPRR